MAYRRKPFPDICSLGLAGIDCCQEPRTAAGGAALEDTAHRSDCCPCHRYDSLLLVLYVLLLMLYVPVALGSPRRATACNARLSQQIVA